MNHRLLVILHTLAACLFVALQPPTPDDKAIAAGLRANATALAGGNSTEQAVGKNLAAQADILDPPPKLLSQRLKLVGYQKWPVTMDPNSYGSIAVSSASGHLFAIGHGARGGTTVAEVQSQGWGLDLATAPRAVMVKQYGSSCFAGLVPKDEVQCLYHDGDKLWWVKAQDYLVGTADPHTLGFYSFKDQKAYGPWQVDIGAVRTRHFLTRFRGRLTAGACLDSGSASAPWGLGASWVLDEPDETTPTTGTVLKTLPLAFNDMAHRLTRAGDFVPQNNFAQFPPPINGVGEWQGCDTCRGMTAVGDQLLYAASLGTSNVGYKILMPDGTHAGGQAAWSYRPEWIVLDGQQAVEVMAQKRQPWDITPSERFDPKALYGLQMRADCEVSGLHCDGKFLYVQMRQMDRTAGAANPGLLTACFEVTP